ncbi:MAG: hypothetical protein ACRCZF_14850 [Gemmataceae bacterium]
MINPTYEQARSLLIRWGYSEALTRYFLGSDGDFAENPNDALEVLARKHKLSPSDIRRIMAAEPDGSRGLIQVADLKPGMSYYDGAIGRIILGIEERGGLLRLLTLSDGDLLGLGATQTVEIENPSLHGIASTRPPGSIHLIAQPIDEFGQPEDHSPASIVMDKQGRDQLIAALIEGRGSIDAYGESGGGYQLILEVR